MRSADPDFGIPPKIVDLEGLEPPAPWFEAKCSIQLSYRSKIFTAENLIWPRSLIEQG